MRKSSEVLQECIDLQEKKGQDYQSKASKIQQADYYRRGIDSINDIIWAKFLRIESVVEASRNGSEPNFESLEDSYKDLINYASFAVVWLRGEMEGQTNTNMFNEKK